MSVSEKNLHDYAQPYDSDEDVDVQEIIQKRKEIRKEILAARSHKNWRDYVNQSYKYAPFTAEQRQKRIDRLEFQF